MITTLIGIGAGLVIAGVTVWRIWKSKGRTSEKVARTAEELAKAAILASQAKDAVKKK